MTIDAIVGTSIIDLVFIGPAELAVSSRLSEGDHRLADLVAAAERRCAEHRITRGTTASGNASNLLGRGYDFLVLGADTTMLRQRAQALVDGARTAVSAVGR